MKREGKEVGAPRTDCTKERFYNPPAPDEIGIAEWYCRMDSMPVRSRTVVISRQARQ